MCTGAKPNTTVFKRHFDEQIDWRSGALMVDDHLSVEGHPNIFAIGDIMVQPKYVAV